MDVTTTESTATINWDTNINTDGVIEYWIAGQIAETEVESGPFSKEHSIIITGLSSSTTYNFRIISSNASETNIYTNSFTTTINKPARRYRNTRNKKLKIS